MSKDAQLSQTVYHLLDSIFRDEALVSAHPSSESIQKVIDMLVDDGKQGDNETEKMNDALRLLFPEFLSAEDKRPVVLFDPHPALTFPV